MSKVWRFFLELGISLLVGVVVGFGVFVLLRFAFGWDMVDIGDLPTNLGRVAALLTLTIMLVMPKNRPTVKVAKGERDLALASPPPAGHGTVYVLRNGIQGWAVGLNVVVDGRTMAFLRTPRFTRLDVPPGQHALSIESSLKGAKKVQPSSTEFTLAPGEVVVFSFSATLNGPIPIVREPDTATALKKLSTVTMVAPDQESSMFSELAA